MVIFIYNILHFPNILFHLSSNNLIKDNSLVDFNSHNELTKYFWREKAGGTAIISNSNCSYMYLPIFSYQIFIYQPHNQRDYNS